MPPRRSGRVVRPPLRYRQDEEANVVVTDGVEDDPLSFQNAMEDSDKERWLEAMKQEMESMYSNSVWVLVDPPQEVRPIGCKWIYKRKRGVDGDGNMKFLSDLILAGQKFSRNEILSSSPYIQSTRCLIDALRSLGSCVWYLGSIFKKKTIYAAEIKLYLSSCRRYSPEDLLIFCCIPLLFLDVAWATILQDEPPILSSFSLMASKLECSLFYFLFLFFFFVSWSPALTRREAPCAPALARKGEEALGETKGGRQKRCCLYKKGREEERCRRP